MAKTNRQNKSKNTEVPVQKMDGKSHSPQKELLGILKSQCPEVFTEGKIDVEKLKKTLGEELDTNNERYGLNWAGKSECFRHIQETTTATLKPCRDESVDFDTTENIFIEGDNLEVLKILQKTYQNKIKMIYIDPPYNTGNDSFIYPDRFKEEKEDYEQRAGIKDAEGLLTKDGFWRKNSKDSGHFHSNWLSMMYPRLFLAKNLLCEDGVIFVSIDDNEIHNLRMIMNEIFGEENFLANVMWQKVYSPRMDAQGFSSDHDHILVFQRSDSFNLGKESFSQNERQFTGYDNVRKKKYRPRNLRKEGSNSRRVDRPKLFYPITLPNGDKVLPIKPDGSEGCWRWSETKYLRAKKDALIEFVETEHGWQVYVKQFWDDKSKRPSSTVWLHNEAGHNHAAVDEIKKLFNVNVFSNPKPTTLIRKMLTLATETGDDDIVLDFFAGSCATAQAVMQSNVEDGSNRRFICVQLAEPCEEKSEAYQTNYKTIADIGKERIRRAGKKIKDESAGKLDFDKEKLDLGFKIFKLDESNFKQWRQKVSTGGELRDQMQMFVDNVKKGADVEDMLFEIILKNSRFDLNVKVEKKSLDGIDFYLLADGVEIVCLAEKVTKKLIEKVLKQKPERFTCLDVAFKNNDQLKTNTALQMEAEKIDFKVI